MDGFASFPHSIGMRHHHKTAMLQAALGDRMGAYGKVCALLEVLYECGGSISLDNGGRRYLESELDCDEEGLDVFLAACAGIEWIDPDPLSDGIVTSHNVREQIDYCRTKAEAGKRSGDARRKRSAERAKS